jgi:YVTN family beta-propeller protein
MRAHLLSLVALLALALPLSAAGQTKDYLLFESGPVRPIALNPAGDRLFAVNIPDNRLEVFRKNNAGNLIHLESVAVGMEPVAVAARNATEVWVVNHLSDSVSIVDVSTSPARVTRTLLVGDEPRDIVFAGSDRAFITTAHRGQHRTDPSIGAVTGAGDPELTTASVPRADVWVFSGANPGAGFGGTPLEIIELFGDTPRALTVSADGNTVYAAAFHSGNQTAAVNEGAVCDGFAGAAPCPGDGITSPNGIPGGDLPGGNPGPDENHQLVTAPEVSLIVQFDEASGEWRDELGRNWSNGIRFHLPDLDVFTIDASTLDQTGSFAHVGTILFNMAVNPVTGNVYVSNADSQNLTRFEGAGTFGGSTVQGNLAQYGISVLSGASTVTPRHLNKHINYATLPAPAGTRDHSLATPLEMVVSADGATLYVAAFGSNKVGVFQTATLENDTFDPTVQSAQYIDVGGGPSGLILNELQNRLYVYNRFDHNISIVDTGAGTEIGTVPLYSPEPAHVIAGRPMLYDAFKTSSNGEASCSSCHIFGDFDSLAWDLGDPDADVSTNTMPLTPVPVVGNVNGGADNDEFHPMKGPMTTQTLRGMANSGGLHWRGDRVDGFFGMDDPYLNGPATDAGDEDLNFRNFIVAFPGLVGGDTPATNAQLQADMQDFSDFALEMVLPPNPIRALSNVLSGDASTGQTIYLNDNMDTQTCEGCHTLEPENGFFGTGGLSSFEGETQLVKVPHLRNMYQKIGMFGHPDASFFLSGDNLHKGDQVRGFGFLHDGSTDSLFRFFRATVFALFPPLIGFDNDGQRTDMEQFMFEFPSDLAPAVGQQITDDGGPNGDVPTRIALLRGRANAAFTSKFLGGVVTDCDLVVRGLVAGEERGYLYDGVTFDADRAAETNLTQAAMDAIADVAGQYLTYTCAPPGSGMRMAIDRDLDGELDADEIDDATDPANAGSIFGACNDGFDNDGDGAIDLADAACTSSGLHIENPECNDGVDNDGDGGIDLADLHCSGPSDNRERIVVASCGLGFELAFLLPVWMAVRRRRAARA